MKKSFAFVVLFCVLPLLAADAAVGFAGGARSGETFTLGADVSWITEMERKRLPLCGCDGKPKDCFEVLKEFGLSAVRLRVWVDPSAHGGWCDAADVLAKAKRAQAAGLEVMVNFHYSDWWADPNRQPMPEAWKGLSRDGILQALARHTEDVLGLLKRNGVRVKWVQVGNETSHGLLWSPKLDQNRKINWVEVRPGIFAPEMEKDAFADLYGHPENYAACFKAGYAAVKRVYPDAIVIVHHADSCNVQSVDYNLEQLAKHGAKWDMIGLSLYPYHQRHRNKDEQKSIDESIETLHHLAKRWNCDTMIVETSFECVPEKYEEGRSRLAQVIRRSKSAPRCRGVFYWEPQCNPSFHKYPLGAFDDQGRPTPIMDGFRGSDSIAPPSPSGLVVYPEYPEAITRDYAYAVCVVQGEVRKSLPVYNHCEKSPLNTRTRGGDVNRRFCEFAFAGDPVRVDIRVAEDVKSYKVFPARLGLKSAFRDGVISVWLEKPTYFGIQLNDYDKTILSVFADAPESPEKVPQKGAPGVLFVEGWKDAPGADGVIETDTKTKEIYLAPGAVLNARLRIAGRGTWLHGRGMILDPLSDIFRYDQTKNTRRGLVSAGAGCTIEDVKLVDARTFNICAWGPDVTIRHVKELASMMCSDGFTNGGKGLLAEHCWLYVGDNALVVSGLKDSVYRDIALGTSCAAIFPQGNNANVRMENIDVFRADDGLINNFHNGVLRRNNKWSEMNGGLQKKEPGPQDLQHLRQDFSFKNLSAVDCTLFSHFFSGRNMGTLPKAFSFDGVSLPLSTGRTDWRLAGKPGGPTVVVRNDPKKWLVTDNYALTFTNLWIAGKRATFGEKDVAGADKLKIRYAESAAAREVPLAPDRHEVNWTCPYKVFRGPALVRDWRLVRRAEGERRLTVPDPGANLVRESKPRQSVWQRAPSWSVKLETSDGTDGARRVYELIQCERGAGMQAVVTDEALARGAGTYRLTFEAQAECRDGKLPLELRCVALSNEWRKESKAAVGGDWTPVSVDFDLPIDPQVTDLVSVGVFSTVPADRIRLRKVVFAKR